jgi:ABC-type tungstate transport system permease subunit
VDLALTEVLRRRPFSKAWRAVLGRSYGQAVRIAVTAKAYAQTDATAFINTMDAFHDVLLDCVFQHDGLIGQYQLGNIGSVLNVGSKFAQQYPRLFEAVKEMHEARLQSVLSHAYVKGTRRPTGRIGFAYLSKIRPRLLAAYAELEARW